MSPSAGSPCAIIIRSSAMPRQRARGVRRRGVLAHARRFNQLEVWQRLGLPIEECIEITDNSETMKLFRSPRCSRSDRADREGYRPVGPKVQDAFAAMGAIGFAETDAAQ